MAHPLAGGNIPERATHPSFRYAGKYLRKNNTWKTNKQAMENDIDAMYDFTFGVTKFFLLELRNWSIITCVHNFI